MKYQSEVEIHFVCQQFTGARSGDKRIVDDSPRKRRSVKERIGTKKVRQYDEKDEDSKSSQRLTSNRLEGQFWDHFLVFHRAPAFTLLFSLC